MRFAALGSSKSTAYWIYIMNINQTAILTTELRIALYRRVVALAYQNFCLSKGVSQPLELDAL